jgi:hypothetical protein
MGKVVPLDFGVESEPGRYGPDTSARLVNAYAEQAGKGGKIQFPIYSIEGLKSFATLTGGSVTRGAIALDTVGYVISGTIVFKVDSGGGVTNVGSFPGSDPVFTARNRKSATPQIALVSGGLRYIIENDVVSSISDVDLPNANSVTYQGGYFIWTISDGRFFISSIDEGTAIDALDFATAEANPDGLTVGHARGTTEVLFFGPQSVEFWSNTGASFPFERIPGTGLQNLGLLCAHTVKDLNDVVFFVASDGTVRVLNGYQPERISTHAVERDIFDTADKTSITATAYSIRGHQFYILSAANWTWVYDGLTGLWHERESYQLTRWRGEQFVNINGVLAVGDYASGLLYRVDPDTYTEAGNTLLWTLRTSPMHAYPNRVSVDRLFIDTISGTGLVSLDDHESDPLVMMRFSDDNGFSWSTQRTETVGAVDERRKRVVFNRCGQTLEDGRIWEISMSAPVIRGLTGAAVDIEMIDP